MVTKTFFRIIGLEETASSCQSILEPSFNNQVFCPIGSECMDGFSDWFELFVGSLRCSWELMFFLALGDDDIRPRHDLHYVPHHNHQIIDQIGNQYFSVGLGDKYLLSNLILFKFVKLTIYVVSSIKSINLKIITIDQKLFLFIQNLHCFGIHVIETDKRHQQIHSLF